MNKTIKTLIITTALALLTSTGAFAQTAGSAASLTLTGGAPTVTCGTILDFGALTLNGAAQTKASGSDLILVVNDASGTGDGWKLAASAPGFTGGATGTGLVDTIPAAGLSLKGSTALFSGHAALGWTIPASRLDVNLTEGNNVFLTAAAGEGVGAQTITVAGANIVLDIPFNAAAGDYTSTVTFTISDNI